MNLDEGVDGKDLSIQVQKWGVEDALADTDDSASVDAGDLGALLSSWTPPAGTDLDVADSVSVSEAGSETTHNLQSSGNGGTGVEGGYTRRYAGQADGAWFSYDLSVPTGVNSFVIRVAETYPEYIGARDYRVLTDGAEALSREIIFLPGNQVGLYHVEVSGASAMTADGKVTVRFQEESPARNLDPSVAAVWLLVPAP